MSTVYFESRAIPTVAFQDESDDEGFIEDPTYGAGLPLDTRSYVGTPVDARLVDPVVEVNGVTYDFLFWNVVPGDGTPVPGYPRDELRLHLPNLASNVEATAWYVPRGGGPGPASVRALAFSPDVNRFFKESPVASTTPANAWAGGNAHNVATHNGPTTILPRAKLNRTPGTKFLRWITPKNGAFTTSGTSLTVRTGASTVVVAPYDLPTDPTRLGIDFRNSIPYWLWLLLHGRITQEALDNLRGPRPGHVLEEEILTLRDVRDRLTRLEQQIETGRPGTKQKR